jgi:hypothetical protein
MGWIFRVSVHCRFAQAKTMLRRQVYVECKAYRTSSVPLEDVAKFKVCPSPARAAADDGYTGSAAAQWHIT